MLRQRTAGDKSWPITCSNTTLGTTDKDLDLSGAHLSYGDFEEARFIAKWAIQLDGAGLAHADLSGARLTAGSEFVGFNRIDFSEADLTSADLSGSELTVTHRTDLYFGSSTIDFTEATLANAELNGWKLTAGTSIVGLPPLAPPSPPPLPPHGRDRHDPAHTGGSVAEIVAESPTPHSCDACRVADGSSAAQTARALPGKAMAVSA